MRLSLLVCLAATAYAADPALRIEGIAGRDGVVKPAQLFSMADLTAIPHVTLQAKTPHDGKFHTFEGVLMADLLKHAGLPQGDNVRGPVLARYLLVTAHDGYRTVFALPEFDPAYTDNNALLADKMDGKPLDDHDGPLHLVMPNEKREARWVRMVERIEVLSAPEPIR